MGEKRKMKNKPVNISDKKRRRRRRILIENIFISKNRISQSIQSEPKSIKLIKFILRIPIIRCQYTGTKILFLDKS